MTGDRRITRVSEVADIRYYRDVAAGRRRPHELAYFSTRPTGPTPTTRGEAYEEGTRQGFFCQFTALGMIPSPRPGMPEELVSVFFTGVLAGAEEALRHAAIEEELAEQDRSNVIPFRPFRRR